MTEASGLSASADAEFRTPATPNPGISAQSANIGNANGSSAANTAQTSNVGRGRGFNLRNVRSSCATNIAATSNIGNVSGTANNPNLATSNVADRGFGHDGSGGAFRGISGWGIGNATGGLSRRNGIACGVVGRGVGGNSACVGRGGGNDSAAIGRGVVLSLLVLTWEVVLPVEYAMLVVVQGEGVEHLQIFNHLHLGERGM
ncbi:hypothetical protein JCGZ_09004 [Jatropha curcas]|uniref:Uncharacterized protein n=1 Tax=Jatropha curcas TaxID=180498 RepID=A0A067KH49_JATCU|nr:hypothetical protein JCGZ_09004 [Jatropha curcas]